MKSQLIQVFNDALYSSLVSMHTVDMLMIICMLMRVCIYVAKYKTACFFYFATDYICLCIHVFVIVLIVFVMPKNNKAYIYKRTKE